MEINPSKTEFKIENKETRSQLSSNIATISKSFTNNPSKSIAFQAINVNHPQEIKIGTSKEYLREKSVSNAEIGKHHDGTKKSKKKFSKAKEKRSSDITESARSSKLAILGGASGESLKRKVSYIQRISKSSSIMLDEDFDNGSNDYLEEDEILTEKRMSRVRKLKKKDRKDLLISQPKNVSIQSLKVVKKKKSKRFKGGISESERKSSESLKEDAFINELERIKNLTVGHLAMEGEMGKEAEGTVSVSTLLKATKKKTKGKKSTAPLSSMDLEEVKKMNIEKKRLEEISRGVEKQKLDIQEQQMREEQLTKSLAGIQKIIDHNKKLAKEEKENLEWQLYVDCGRLPNPSLCDQMNTYLHLWSLVMQTTTVEDASKRTYDVIKLLTDLEDLLDATEEEHEQTIRNWKVIYEMLKQYQKLSLSVATFELLKNVEKNMRRVDLMTADYNFQDDHMDMNLWLRVNLPTPLPNPRRPPKPMVDVTFPSIQVRLLFPQNLDSENLAIRVMYLKYDHLSEQSISYYLHGSVEPEESLLTVVKQEWRAILMYKYQHSLEMSIEGLDAPLPELADDEEVPIVPFKKLNPSPSDYLLNKEFKEFYQCVRNFFVQYSEDELNLRKYAIVGGVYHINLLYQPPQPQEYVTMDMNVVHYYLPKELKYIECLSQQLLRTFSRSFSRVNLRSIQDISKAVVAFEPLLQVTIACPKHVIFLQPPLVYRWDYDYAIWNNSDIENVVFDEENHIVNFKTSVFGEFAFATLRYINLPYTNWRITPETDDSVTVKILCPILRLDFNIKGRLVCLKRLENNPTNALKDILGKYLKINRLKRQLKDAGVDIFPEADAICYVISASEKHGPMVKHLYYNMAALSNSFKFAWSRWNASAGRRNVVFNMKEFCPSIGKTNKTYSTVHTTPLKTAFVDCNESRYDFLDVELENVKFSADLYNLVKVTSGIAIRNKVLSANKDTVYTVAQFLMAVRLHCFS